MLLSTLRRLDLPRADDISRTHLYHLLAAYVLISLPMMTLFPLWLSAVVLLAAAAKFITIRRQIRFSKWLLLPFAFGCFVLIVVNAGTIGVEYAGVALLLLFAALKLLEAREQRDAFILMLIYLLLILGALMADDGPLTFFYLIVCFLYNLYIQMRIAQPPDMGISLRQNIRTLVKILLICLPFVIGLFFLFPRIDPLWRQPTPPRATTGLSDEMSPNSLSDLTRDGGLAFRVRFDGDIPDNAQLYWRGPVLVDFDGKTWRRNKSNLTPPPLLDGVADSKVSYTNYHDGTTGVWILPLDLPGSIPEKARMNTAYELGSLEALSKPTAFKLTSYLRYRTPILLPADYRRNTFLPANIFPRTRALAQQLHEQYPNPAEFARQVLKYFSDNPFYYDLAPPTGNADMDRFLFENRSGYCEHYASSFTFMMRSQGVPARVVTGYQGAQLNSVSGEMEIRQYNAHAWSEIYLIGQGWVRIDPTAAISPERVNSGSPFGTARNTDTIATGARWEMQSDTFRYLSIRLRAMSAFWENWIINYNDDKQNSLWQRLGLSAFKDIAWILFIVVLMPFVALLVWWYRRYRRKHRGDAVWQAMQPFVRYLNRLGIEKPDAVPWRQFITDHPQLAHCQNQATQVIQHYYRLRYHDETIISHNTLASLKHAIREFIDKANKAN